MIFNKDHMSFYLVKILAIYYVGLIFGIGTLFVSGLTQKYITNKVVNNRDDEHKTTLQLSLECIFLFGTINTVAYILRNALQHVSFPLDGYGNFDYSKLKELSSGALITVILINTCKPLVDKMSIIRNRLMK
jgi:hypothetical protein